MDSAAAVLEKAKALGIKVTSFRQQDTAGTWLQGAAGAGPGRAPAQGRDTGHPRQAQSRGRPAPVACRAGGRGSQERGHLPVLERGLRRDGGLRPRWPPCRPGAMRRGNVHGAGTDGAVRRESFAKGTQADSRGQAAWWRSLQYGVRWREHSIQGGTRVRRSTGFAIQPFNCTLLTPSPFNSNHGSPAVERTFPHLSRQLREDVMTRLRLGHSKREDCQATDNGHSSAVLWALLGALAAPKGRRIQAGVAFAIGSPLLDQLAAESERQRQEAERRERLTLCDGGAEALRTRTFVGPGAGRAAALIS